LSDIRVTCSGLISLAVAFSSIITGAIFTLILTRQLSVEEFGTWGLIGSIVSYMLLMESPIFFWITREIARGVPSAKTSLTVSGMFSTIAMLLFLIVAYFVGNQSNVDVTIMMIAFILVPVNFLNHTLTGINQGWKPQVASYGFLSTEISKIPLALILIYFLDLGILGVIITTLLSYLASIIIQLKYSREKLKNKFEIKYLKKWLKLSWVALYRDIPGTLYVSDIVIFSMITGNVAGIAYITAARAISNLVKHSEKIAIAVYPKLLAGGKQELLQENLVRVFYFAFPTIAFSVVFARPGLFALNPEYEIAASIVVFLAIRTFLSTINRIFRAALQGIEKVDVSDKSKFKDYAKSFLIIVPTIRTIQYVSYVILLLVGLFLLVNLESSQLDLVVYWAVVALSVEAPFVIYFSILIKRNFTMALDFKAILKYILSSIVSFGLVYLLMEKFLVYEISIFDFLPNLLPYILLAITCYLSLTFLIDLKTKNLFKAIIKEVKGR